MIDLNPSPDIFAKAFAKFMRKIEIFLNIINVGWKNNAYMV